MTSLSKYVKKFSKLRVDRSKGSPAPHKPILLLALLDQVEEQQVTINQFCITPELVARFKDYWSRLVDTSRFTANFSLPYYHLKRDGFWHLHTYPGKELVLTSSNSVRSFAQLKDVINYGTLDPELFDFFTNDSTRLILRQTLLTTYFKQDHLQPTNDLVNEVINQILHEPPAVYKRKAENFDEEEVFIRCGIFKKEIPKIYNYTCSISGLRIITDSSTQMIDACHIVPFSESHDDTIGNGISLCPNLHRAFDRGLISVDKEYRVLVKPFFEEGKFYSIKQFHQKPILLPKSQEFFPSQDNLEIHRAKYGFLDY